MSDEFPVDAEKRSASLLPKIARLELSHEVQLSELLMKITDENCHTEVDTGSAIGEEVW